MAACCLLQSARCLLSSVICLPFCPLTSYFRLPLASKGLYLIPCALYPVPCTFSLLIFRPVIGHTRNADASFLTDLATCVKRNSDTY